MGNKGDRRERELVNELYDRGFMPIRAPASGSATERELPDVLAGNGDKSYAIEAKSAADGTVYINAREIDYLILFAEMFGARARIGIRYDREDWKFIHPTEMGQTRGGNYKIEKDRLLKQGRHIDEVFGSVPDNIDPTIDELLEMG